MRRGKSVIVPREEWIGEEPETVTVYSRKPDDKYYSPEDGRWYDTGPTYVTVPTRRRDMPVPWPKPMNRPMTQEELDELERQKREEEVRRNYGAPSQLELNAPRVRVTDGPDSGLRDRFASVDDKLPRGRSMWDDAAQGLFGAAKSVGDAWNDAGATIAKADWGAPLGEQMRRANADSGKWDALLDNTPGLGDVRRGVRGALQDSAKADYEINKWDFRNYQPNKRIPPDPMDMGWTDSRSAPNGYDASLNMGKTPAPGYHPARGPSKMSDEERQRIRAMSTDEFMRYLQSGGGGQGGQSEFGGYERVPGQGQEDFMRQRRGLMFGQRRQ